MGSNKKRILVFIDWYLPGYKAGGPITSCANLTWYLSEECEFHVVCGDRDYQESKPYTGLRFNEWVEVGSARVMYLPPAHQTRKRIDNIILEVEPSVVYINGIFSKVFSIFPLLAMRKHSETLTVVAPRGMLAPSALRIKGFKKKFFLRFFSLFGLFRHVRFHATNPSEAEQIKRWFGNADPFIVENIPGIPVNGKIRSANKEKGELKLYALARIAPEKNIDFALSCLEGIPSEVRLTYDLIGSEYDVNYGRKCRELADGLPANVKVRFLPPVPPSDIPAAVRDYHAFFLPTRGENYGHAIVEALLLGLPVIISDKTPWKNLDNRNLGFDLPLVPKKFIDVLISLAKMDEDEFYSLYDQVDMRTRRLIDVDKIISEYEELFDD